MIIFFILVAAFIILSGLMSLREGLKCNSGKSRIIVYALIIVWGILILFFGILRNNSLALFFLFLGSAVFFFVLGGTSLRKVLLCKIKVVAILKELEMVNTEKKWVFRTKKYKAFFEYVHNNENITSSPSQLFSSSFADKILKDGNTYKLYISEKEPEMCVYFRRIMFADVMNFLYGLLFLFFSVVILVLW